MQMVVIAVGKLKERYWRDAEAEYVKRLRPYASFVVEEVNDEPESVGDERAKRAEGGRILSRLRERDYVVALDSRGKRMTSEMFASHMEQLQAAQHGRFVFVIGGSLGLYESVLQRSDLLLSFSDFTFPHQLMRVILLEQIYRAFRIQTGAPYHK